MQELFSLGELYPSDFLKVGEQPRSNPFEIKLILEDDGFVHLEKVPHKDLMWGERYWYSSGTNLSMSNALKDLVDSVLPFFKTPGRILDIASNDGTLLSHVPKNWKRVGIDPSDGEIYDKACQHGIIVKDYFSAEVLYRCRLFPPLFDVISCAGMFYDLQDPDKFLADVCEVMHDEGILVLQLSYTPLMIQQMAFDNLCHEHYAYHTLSSIKTLCERNNLVIVDTTLNDVNGGSMRVFVRKEKANPKNFGTQAYRDVCKYRVGSLLAQEMLMAVDLPEAWMEFHEDILKLKAQVVDFIAYAKKRGKTIMGYGASTKGNTLLQFFGLDNTLIDAIAERQECKWGLRTVGSNIPIISEDEMRKANPDYLLILPWHFVGSFQEREAEYLNKGGKFIVPCPRFEIIEK